MNLQDYTAQSITAQIKARQLSASEVCQATLDRIEKIDSKINAFIQLDREQALADAKKIDELIAAGQDPGLLAGVPIALKDNLCTKNLPTTCASNILKGWQPVYNATVVDKIKQAGGIVIGKVNLDEFAMGSSCETSAYGPTNNPWNQDFVTGGSSGGSAAAVAADLTTLSLGSDTGGSIRQPAAFCGVLGLKPTYGRVSRYGLVAFASSLDQIGPFAHTIEDCATMLQVIAGHDAKDSTSASLDVPNYNQALGASIKGLKIGLPKEYFADGLDDEVRQAIEQAKVVLEEQGAELIDVSLPHSSYCLATYYLVATAEASSNLARYDGVQYGFRGEADFLNEMYQVTRAQGFGPEVKRRIMLGTYALSAGYYDAYYKKALQVRTLIQNDFINAFKQCDLLLTPTTATAAFKQGEKTDNPLSMYLSDIFTISINLAGLPGLAVPCGFTKSGLPMGMQLIGKAFDEATLLQVAHHYQQQTAWHNKRATNL